MNKEAISIIDYENEKRKKIMEISLEKEHISSFIASQTTKLKASLEKDYKRDLENLKKDNQVELEKYTKIKEEEYLRRIEILNRHAKDSQDQIIAYLIEELFK
ncbi:MAG: hypothetical protein LBV55_04385 [Acholeplasmatales bacterium]|jgi:hypothetical protein|nr:hypothetical protein [Acholeplasmatales bacterium]